MSYDVWLEMDTGGPEPAQITEGINHTSNTSGMWRAAGAEIAAMHGQPAGDCAVVLDQAIKLIEAKPQAYRRYEPPNGWGTVESTLRFLRELRGIFTEHPKALVHVWR